MIRVRCLPAGVILYTMLYGTYPFDPTSPHFPRQVARVQRPLPAPAPLAEQPSVCSEAVLCPKACRPSWPPLPGDAGGGGAVHPARRHRGLSCLQGSPRRLAGRSPASRHYRHRSIHPLACTLHGCGIRSGKRAMCSTRTPRGGQPWTRSADTRGFSQVGATSLPPHSPAQQHFLPFLSISLLFRDLEHSCLLRLAPPPARRPPRRRRRHERRALPARGATRRRRGGAGHGDGGGRAPAGGARRGGGHGGGPGGEHPAVM